MKLYIVKNSGLAAAPGYNISLVVDRAAETVKATLALRVPQNAEPAIKDEPSFSYVEKDSVLFSTRELRAGRDWSERQAYLAGFDWSAGRFRSPVPLSTFTMSTRFTASEAARHVWNGNFLVGLNVPFVDSTFDECFITVNLGATACACSVDGLMPEDIEESSYQHSGYVREMVFPSVKVSAVAPTVKAGEPASFNLQMVDGLGNPMTRDAELHFETVNGFLPVTRRTSQGGKAVATVLTTGLQTGDVVRLKAGFKFYPAADDAEVAIT